MNKNTIIHTYNVIIVQKINDINLARIILIIFIYKSPYNPIDAIVQLHLTNNEIKINVPSCNKIQRTGSTRCDNE